MRSVSIVSVKLTYNLFNIFNHNFGDFQCLFSLKMVDTTCQNIALACSKHQRSLPNSIVGRTYDRTELYFFLGFRIARSSGVE